MFAAKLASEILHKRGTQKGAFTIALSGDLGAGKTTFVQGFLRGLGFKRRAQSPTFVIMRRHSLPRGTRRFKNVFHVDAYRLKRGRDLGMLGFKEVLADPRNIVLIEWPERARGILPRPALRIAFRHGKTERERTIIIRA